MEDPINRLLSVVMTSVGLVLIMVGGMTLDTYVPLSHFKETKCTLISISDAYFCGLRSRYLCYDAIYFVELMNNNISYSLIDPYSDLKIVGHTYNCLYKDTLISLDNPDNIHREFNDGIIMTTLGIIFLIIGIICTIICYRNRFRS